MSWQFFMSEIWKVYFFQFQTETGLMDIALMNTILIQCLHCQIIFWISQSCSSQTQYELNSNLLTFKLAMLKRCHWINYPEWIYIDVNVVKQTIIWNCLTVHHQIELRRHWILYQFEWLWAVSNLWHIHRKKLYLKNLFCLNLNNGLI